MLSLLLLLALLEARGWSAMPGSSQSLDFQAGKAIQVSFLFESLICVR